MICAGYRVLFRCSWKVGNNSAAANRLLDRLELLPASLFIRSYSPANVRYRHLYPTSRARSTSSLVTCHGTPVICSEIDRNDPSEILVAKALREQCLLQPSWTKRLQHIHRSLLPFLSYQDVATAQ